MPLRQSCVLTLSIQCCVVIVVVLGRPQTGWDVDIREARTPLKTSAVNCGETVAWVPCVVIESGTKIAVAPFHEDWSVEHWSKVDESHETGECGYFACVHSDAEGTTYVVKEVYVDVTHFGHGPSSENLDSVMCREEEGTIPAGLNYVASESMGNKLWVTDVVCEVGSLASCGLELLEDAVMSSVVLGETGPLAPAKVALGGGGCGTWCADVLVWSEVVSGEVTCEVDVVPGDLCAHSEEVADCLCYTEA